eukprot:1776191-Prymnesium_polylepis.1
MSHVVGGDLGQPSEAEWHGRNVFLLDRAAPTRRPTLRYQMHGAPRERECDANSLGNKQD